MPNLMWFRRDLRLGDNPALLAACEHATDGVIALFVFTPQTWAYHAIAPIQVSFLLENLKILSQELANKNIPLLVREVPYYQNIPELMEKMVRELNIEAIYYNRQYEWDERRRDAAVTERLNQVACKSYMFDDQVIIPPEKMLNNQQQPFKVFTPFKKKWLLLAENYFVSPLPKPKSQEKLNLKPDVIPKQLNVFTMSHQGITLPSAGESAARQRLSLFCKKQIRHYQTTRDFPNRDATSHLSAYLALGVLSGRQCISRVLAESPIAFADLHNKTGEAVWISELIWREFYKIIMFHFPQVCKYKAFKKTTEKLPWRYDKKLFAKWCDGLTGFPLVDAAMRQLNQIGWMHNRLRMVTAMFLSKILFIDWRWGERYFSEHLIDLDFSANNGGWQWSASTGTDAVPYFRIFNPITQSEKYDAKGNFIRQYCPELSHLNSKVIHDPFARGIKFSDINYPDKIVDYKKMRQRTLGAFEFLSRSDIN